MGVHDGPEYAPGHSLYPNTAASAAYPARGVNEEHLDTPHWDELKAPHRPRVIASPSPSVARADCPAIGPGALLCLNRRFAGVSHPAHRTVHKRFEILHAIQHSLDVHPAPLSVRHLFAIVSLQSSEAGCTPSCSTCFWLYSGHTGLFFIHKFS